MGAPMRLFDEEEMLLGRTPMMMGAPQMPPMAAPALPPPPATMAQTQMPQDLSLLAESPRDIFQSVDPSQFLMTPEQEADRKSKQQQVMIAQILSNQAGNAANFFKPGSYDMGAQAKVFDGLNRMTDEPIAALGRKQNATQQAEAIEQRRLANDSVRSKMDPNSDVSKGLRSRVVEEARARAKMVPSMAEVLEAKAAAYERGQQSGVDAEAELKSLKAMFGDAIKLDYNKAVAGNQAAALSQKDAHFKAEQEGKQLDRQLRAEELHNKNMLERMKLDLERDKLDAKDAAAEMKIVKPQEKLNEQLSKIDMKIGGLKRIMTLKSNVDTGPWEKLVGKATDFFDMTAQDRMELRALTGSIFNEILHELSGAAISPSEMERLSANIPSEGDQDGIFVQKIRTAISEAERLKKLAKDRYQTEGGKLTDKSDTARKAVGQAPQLPALGDPGKMDRARQVLANPNASPAAKAGAQKYLDDHGAK